MEWIDVAKGPKGNVREPMGGMGRHECHGYSWMLGPGSPPRLPWCHRGIERAWRQFRQAASERMTEVSMQC